MAFVNKRILDSEIENFNLPFDIGSGRYWTRDESRRLYLWGGACGNPAFGEDIQWIFYLGINDSKKPFKIIMKKGAGSKMLSDLPYLITWNSIESITPNPSSTEELFLIISHLKDSLEIYGEDGKENTMTPERVVKFQF